MSCASALPESVSDLNESLSERNRQARASIC